MAKCGVAEVTLERRHEVSPSRVTSQKVIKISGKNNVIGNLLYTS